MYTQNMQEENVSNNENYTNIKIELIITSNNVNKCLLTYLRS
jgi:hypothetical protein